MSKVNPTESAALVDPNTLRKLLDLPDVPLAQGFPTKTMATGPLMPPQLNAGDFKLSFEADGRFVIQGLYQPGDTDEDGVVGSPSQVPGEPGALPPQILLDGTRAYLKYQILAHLKAEVGVALPFSAADIQGELTAVLMDYRAHAPKEHVPDAAVADLERPRLIVEKTALDTLGVGDALAFQVRSRLGLSIELNWADLFTSNLGGLSLLREAELIQLQMALDATLSASVALTDDYLLVFSRPAQDQIHIAVRRAPGQQATVGGRLGIEVAALDPTAVEQQLEAVVTALAGAPMAVIDDLVARLNLLDLTDKQRAQLRAAFERLHLPGDLADLLTLKQSWADFKKGVRQAIRQVAELRIKAGVAYEYVRIGDGLSLLEVVLPLADARTFHGSLLRGNTVDLIKWMKAKGLKPMTYFNQDSILRKQSWGFTLGIGRWQLGFEATETNKWVRQTDWRGYRRYAYLGVRTGQDEGPHMPSGWTFDLKAEMTGFSSQPAPSDFYYGVYLLLSRPRHRFTRAELQAVLDEAAVWGVVDLGSMPAALKTLEELAADQELETRLELKIDNDLFRELLRRTKDFDPALFSRALARAMPFVADRVHQDPWHRQNVYTSVWAAYMEAVRRRRSVACEDLPFSELTGLVAHEILKHDFGGRELAEWEKRGPGEPFTFAWLIDSYRGTVGCSRTFMDGFTYLDGAIREATWGHEAIETAFGKLQALLGTAFHIRAAGAALVELARNTPQGEGAVERTLTVGIPGKNRQVIFSMSR